MLQYRTSGKRLLDLVIVGAAIPVWLPLTAVVAAVVYLFMGPPILFRQMRPGLGGRLFGVVKFRTMTDARNPSGAPLSDESRLTPFGKVLRATSLDELPELFNVLRGEMSLVGPRPLLPQYLPLYTVKQARRHEVKPGLTGLAQVRGRNLLTWKEKLKLDIEYVNGCSFTLDLKILLLTVRHVIARRGITQPGHATTEYFGGTKTP